MLCFCCSVQPQQQLTDLVVATWPLFFILPDLEFLHKRTPRNPMEQREGTRLRTLHSPEHLGVRASNTGQPLGPARVEVDLGSTSDQNRPSCRPLWEKKKKVCDTRRLSNVVYFETHLAIAPRTPLGIDQRLRASGVLSVGCTLMVEVASWVEGRQEHAD